MGSETESTAGNSTATGTSNPNSNGKKNQRHRGKGKGNGHGSHSVTTKKFKGEVEGLATLGLRGDVVQTDNFLVFTRGITQHVLSTFSNPGDVVPLVKDLQKPMPRLMKQMPSLAKLKEDYGLDPAADESTLSAEDKSIIKELESLLESERKAFVTRKATLTANMPKLFGLMWGQCTPTLQQDIRNLADYQVQSDAHNCLWLLTNLKQCVSGCDETQHPSLVYLRTLRSLLTTRQSDSDTLQDHTDRIESRLQALKLLDGDFAPNPLVSAERQILSPSGTIMYDEETAKRRVEERLLALLTLEGANEAKYGGLKRLLANQMVQGVDTYPETRAKAQTLLSKYVPDKPVKQKQPQDTDPNKKKQPGGNTSTEANGGTGGGEPEDTANVNVSFHQRHAPIEGPPVAGTDGNIMDGRHCYACGHPGHISTFCPNVGFQGVQYAFVQKLIQGRTDIISINWLLLDTGSTFSSLCNGGMLTNIVECSPMTSYTNGGQLVYHKKGPLAVMPDVEAYFSPDAIANIVSMKDIIRNYRVTMDSTIENTIVVHMPGHGLKFVGCGNGLYYLDISDMNTHKVNASVSPYLPISLLNVANNNKAYFTRREVEGADLARLIQGRIGWPGDDEYKRIIGSGFIRNCKPTVDDVNAGLAIYGPLKPILQGKMTRKKPQHIEGRKRVPIPSPVLKLHPTEEIATDFFFVEGQPYLLMKGRIYRFRGLNCSRGRGKIETSAALKVFLNQFALRGIKVNCIYGDNEFEKVKGLMGPTPVETCGRDEHVPDIERDIRTVKERSRCTTSTLPYKRIPRAMIDANLKEKIHWLNAFAPKDYLSPSISPAGMILGNDTPDFNHLRLDFGQYCQVHDGTDNTQSPRSIDAIALYPKYNTASSCYFLSLDTGRVIHSHNWTELAINDHVIARVEALAARDGIGEMVDGNLLFEWAPGVPIMNVDDDDQMDLDAPAGPLPPNVTNMPVIYDIDDIMHDPHVAQGADMAQQAPLNAEGVDHVPTATDELPEDRPPAYDHPDDKSDNSHGMDNYDDSETLIDDASDEGASLGEEEGAILGEDEGAPLGEEEGALENTETTELETPHTEETYNNTRPQRERRPPTNYEPSFKGKSYGVQLFNYANSTIEQVNLQQENINNSDNNDVSADLRTTVFNIIFTQMTAEKGLKEFGERAVAAIFKEYNQMEELKVLGPTDVDKLTIDQKKKALRAVNLIKLKRCGKVKARMCANGAPHRKFVPREEAKSPTVSLDGLIMTALIAAHEKRKVITFDVPGAFLQADIPADKFRILKLEGKFVDIMCDVNPEYAQYVRMEQGKRVLYLQILKALYGMIESALLWYELYLTVLEGMGFELNPYDKCIANKMVNGKQCTLAWYVDDNMLTHVDNDVIEEVVQKIEDRFPGLTITRGNEHTFIGMKMRFLDDGKLEITLRDYLQECIDDFGEELGPTVASVAAKWIFDVDANARKLSEDKAEIFHSIVAKLLWVSQRARLDISVPISFLCTRVQSPDVEDWKKLRRTLKFIQQTIDDPRIIGIDSLGDMDTFIDSSHAVHPDMRGHTGGAITFGTGVLAPKCSKQKMNSRSSNETEVIGNSEYLPTNIWHDYFLEAQGHKLKSNIIHQDNEGAEKMAKNGMASCGSRSRHINIKFFWITDRVKQGKITIKHCPTDKMIADFFTKPLQGKKFHMFRRIIMGWDHISTLWTSDPINAESSSSKERVEQNRIVETEKSLSEDGSCTWADVVKNATASASKETRVGVAPRVGVEKNRKMSDLG